MSKFSCTKVLKFCAAHRIEGYLGPCRNLHGHNFTVEVTFVGDISDMGMVADFAEVKRHIGGWIDLFWDHKTILHDSDPLHLPLREHDQPVFMLPYRPTAENLARYLLEYVLPYQLEGTGYEFFDATVSVWETDTGCGHAARS